MYRSFVVCTLMLALCACERGTPVTPPPADTDPLVWSAAFTNRVWLRTDAGAAHGSMQVFLDDGTLISDSCFETYRLSRWRPEGERGLAWQEDGIDIRATIVSVAAGELELQLGLRGGDEVQRFSAAAVPYVCPAMPGPGTSLSPD